MKINDSRAAAVIFITVSAFFWHMANGYPPEAALFPKALLLGIIGLSVVLALRSCLVGERGATLSMYHKGQVLAGLLLTVAYLAIMPLIGYYAATTVFIMVFSFFLRFRLVVLTVLIAVTFPLLIYGVFELLLHIPVPGATVFQL